MSAAGRGVAVVTGGGSGLGRAAALALLADGWRVVVAGRRAPALEETLRLAGDASGRALAVPADIRDTEQVRSLFAAAVRWRGRVDLLFNNAGAAVPRVPVAEVDLADWRTVLDPVATGTFLCSREAFRVMRDQDPPGGRIINNGAPSAHVPRPHAIAYTAAKHAVLGITRSLSLDGRAHGIACGQIDVGNVAPEGGRPQPPSVQADGSTAVEPVIPVERFTEALLLMASMPPGANVQALTVMPTAMPYTGRG